LERGRRIVIKLSKKELFDLYVGDARPARRVQVVLCKNPLRTPAVHISAGVLDAPARERVWLEVKPKIAVLARKHEPLLVPDRDVMVMPVLRHSFLLRGDVSK
jgi:hypothetical protein